MSSGIKPLAAHLRRHLEGPVATQKDWAATLLPGRRLAARRRRRLGGLTGGAYAQERADRPPYAAVLHLDLRGGDGGEGEVSASGPEGGETRQDVSGSALLLTSKLAPPGSLSLTALNLDGNARAG
jgi:hypothetical protein